MYLIHCLITCEQILELTHFCILSKQAWLSANDNILKVKKINNIYFFYNKKVELLV